MNKMPQKDAQNKNCEKHTYAFTSTTDKAKLTTTWTPLSGLHLSCLEDLQMKRRNNKNKKRLNLYLWNISSHVYPDLSPKWTEKEKTEAQTENRHSWY